MAANKQVFDFKKMTSEDIINWCVDNNQVKWLKDNSFVPSEDRRATFFEIRKAFCEKFMPEIIPAAKPKKPTMYDVIDSL